MSFALGKAKSLLYKLLFSIHLELPLVAKIRAVCQLGNLLESCIRQAPASKCRNSRIYNAFAIIAFVPQQYGRLLVQAALAPSRDYITNSRGAWQMGEQKGVHSVCCWSHHWTWKCVEISIYVLQERWQ